MVVAKAGVAFGLLEPESHSATDSAADAAVTALLDHVAEELAREYVRLVEKAVSEERFADDR